MRAWGRALALLVTAVTVTGGTTTASAEDTDRLTGADAAHAEAGEVSAATVVALPDLAITHRLPSGAMNLWRMPLSDLEAGYGQPRLVKNPDYGGFSHDRSRTLTGDVGDITASDDGTADHVIWHAQPTAGSWPGCTSTATASTPRCRASSRPSSGRTCAPVAGPSPGRGSTSPTPTATAGTTW